MRCLVVADLHYSLPQYDWVMNVAGRFDLIIIAGDHLDLSSLVEGRAQTVVIRKYIELLRGKTQVITCSGNHDLDSRDAAGEKAAKWISGFGLTGVPSDGQSLVLEDTLFTICPWWDGPLTREKIAAQLAADALKRTGRWFWVDHPIQAGHGLLRTCPPVTVRQGWLMGRPDRHDLGFQCRAAVRGAACSHHRPFAEMPPIEVKVPLMINRLL